MTTEIVKFEFRGMQVRFVGTADRPEWIAKDVCEALEAERTDSMLRGLDDDEKGTQIVSTPGGPQEMATVTEAGLYKAILRSRKPVAKAFSRWVTHEVLPQIRRTGGYGAYDAADVLAALVTQLPVLIASSVNAAVDAAMKRSDERSLVDANTIGRAGASFINRALKDCAKLLSGGDKDRYRSILSASHVDLRAALNHNGTGRGWSNLPNTKWADCRASLAQMQRAAMRQSPDPQPTLPKVN